MDTVYDIPFVLQLIKPFPKKEIQHATYFCLEENQLWKDDKVTLYAEENDEIEIFFNSNDPDARLYLDALDIMPLDSDNNMIDEEGCIYRVPSENSFILYKCNAGYDALRVDVFKISILCQGKWYYGTFQILPKPLSLQEWSMMKEDLEEEICGLAQDIVRRNIGIGKVFLGNMPPKILYDFLVIKKYSRNVLMALIDISENPRSEIKTKYTNVLKSKSGNCTFDSETVKRYAMRSGSEPTFKVPIKEIQFDIQDNRLLKMIIEEYEYKLNLFIDLLENIEKYNKVPNSGGTKQYKYVWIKSLTDFKEMALKLRNMTAILKTKDWYSNVSKIVEAHIPHSFIMDTRYNVLYQMYTDLKKENISIELDPEFSYTWKRSSYMYEMWCYFKLCRLLLEKYECDTKQWEYIFSDKVLFPFLEEGTNLKFESENIRLELVYDKLLPLNEKNTSMENPLFVARHHSELKTHNRPDIVINVFDKNIEWYLGSIVLECKYRKLNSFWDEKSIRSSRGQLEGYYNNARSIFLLGNFGKELQMRPVTKVFALTPDYSGDGKEQKDFNILVKGFKPTNDNIGTLKEDIFEEIASLENRALSLKGLLKKET